MPSTATTATRALDHRTDTGELELVERVRDGDMAAFEALYTASIDRARRYARSLARCPADADDAVSEVYTRVLDLLERGRGPREGFTRYVLRAVRNLVHDDHRRGGRVVPDDDVVRDLRPVSTTSGPEAAVLEEVEADTARRALAELRDSWREVLLEVEVAERPPRAVAADRGENPHTLASRVHRAREGLRDAYLAEVVDHDDRCEHISRRLGALVRGNVGVRERRRMNRHMDGCEACRRRHDAVRRVAGESRLVPSTPRAA